MLRALLSACRRPSAPQTSSPASRVLWQGTDTPEVAAIQQQHPYPPPQPGGWERRRRQSSGGQGPPPCLHFLRGACRYGTACRFSHDTEDKAAAALPFHHRQPVASQVRCRAFRERQHVQRPRSSNSFINAPCSALRHAASPARSSSLMSPTASPPQANAAAAAAAASSAASSAQPPPWRLRVMSYNILADCLAHEHAAELYSSAPRWSLEWGYRSGLILRWASEHAAGGAGRLPLAGSA